MAEEVFGGAGWREMVALRHRVLRAPLGLRYADAQLEAERDQLHLALRLDGVLAGTLLMLRPDDAGAARLRQMAIAPERAGTGLGRRLIEAGAALQRGFGARTLVLSARETAVGFYLRCGFEPLGASYREVGLPHRFMRRSMEPAAGRG